MILDMDKTQLIKSPQMQEIIERITKKHGIEIYSGDNPYIRLDMPGFGRLCIERILSSPIVILVAHYFEMNGSLVFEPMIDFLVEDSAWIPICIDQPICGYSRCVDISVDGQVEKIINLPQQHDLAEFTEYWAENIRNQNWLEWGVRWEYNV